MKKRNKIFGVFFFIVYVFRYEYIFLIFCYRYIFLRSFRGNLKKIKNSFKGYILDK